MRRGAGDAGVRGMELCRDNVGVGKNTKFQKERDRFGCFLCVHTEP